MRAGVKCEKNIFSALAKSSTSNPIESRMDKNCIFSFKFSLVRHPPTFSKYTGQVFIPTHVG